jgi:site-specific DNA-methyltransferase (adenine-specific)
MLEYEIGDCIDLMKKIESGSVDLILTDPPYGLAGGYVCRSGKGEVFSEEWDEFEDMVELTKKWIPEAKRILKPNGTIMVSGTYHSYPYIAYFLKQNKFYIINDIIWVKPSPQPLLHKSKLRPSTETIIWARKGDKHYFDYEYAMIQNDCKQAGNIVNFNTKDEFFKRDRDHPTQKPSKLWEYLIKISTKRGDTILDPFLGSGTTLLTCSMTGRNGIGFEIDPGMEPIIKKNIELAEMRLEGFLEREDVRKLW